MVEIAGYPFAWVGLPIDDAQCSIKIMAQAGSGKEYLNNILVTWSDDELGRGPAGTAIRTKQPCVVHNTSEDPTFSAWRKAATQHSFNSVLGLPLIYGEKCLGVLVIYANEPDSFDHEEHEFLLHLASNLAFGLQTIKIAHQHDTALLSLQETQEDLNRFTTLDVRTGLPNLASFQQLLSHVIDKSKGSRPFAVYLLRLEGLSRVHEIIGHEPADQILLTVIKRFLEVLPSGATLARITGNKFAILMKDYASNSNLVGVFDSLQKSLVNSIYSKGNEFHLKMSCGVACYPTDSQNIDSLMRMAEVALQHARKNRDKKYQCFDTAMGTEVTKNLALENSMRVALQRGEFILHYQPKVDFTTGRITGAEALVRWLKPGNEMVSPADFIPIAESTGLIIPLGHWILNEACIQAQSWHNAGYPLQIAVNLSALQFGHPKLLRWVASALKQSNLPAHALELEITESMVIGDVSDVISKLQTLRDIGIKLSIDDFGTGYSSLSYLKRFPVDTLKIDQSFIKDMDSNPSDASIVSTIINLAHEFSLTVVAEGVETAAHVELLRDKGCDTLQGYFFSRPLAAEAFAELLHSGKTLNELMESHVDTPQ
ncbi:MAG: GGDEF domain-containing protein [Candidatus Polarisedimenticolaceae bacterium]|nr:GGDEF domain-containing protein [Candidatus Polarisedimenticolaceae bacterium]